MAELVCSPNAVVAFDFLIGNGLSDFQAAAVVGNLQQESGLNPRASGDQGTSHGIAQWRLNRWDNLRSFAAQQGRDPWSLDVQLDFLWHELQSVSDLGLAELRASTSLEAATVVFQDRFERCSVCHTSRRIAYAQSALYACPQVAAPDRAPVIVHRKGGVVVALGLVAALTAASYGAYKVLSRPPLEPVRRRPRPYRPPRPVGPPVRPVRPPYPGPRPVSRPV
jgi:hypothetical protein